MTVLSFPESPEGATPIYDIDNCVSANIVMVTPAMAREFLKKNSHNRSLSTAYVERLAEAIRNGEWMLNGESTKHAPDGTILDGQHRYAAVALSEIPVPMVVVRGVLANAQLTIDVGRRRTFADVLRILGWSNTTVIAGGARLIWAYSTEDFMSAYHGQPSHQTLLHVVERDRKAWEDAGSKSMLWYSQGAWIGTGVACAVIYLFRQIHAEDADDFINKVIHGAGLWEGHPALLLRQRLIREKNEPEEFRINHQFALCIKAWNAYREGRDVGVLRWTRAQKFPRAV